jgi:hypothetical protein
MDMQHVRVMNVSMYADEARPTDIYYNIFQQRHSKNILPFNTHTKTKHSEYAIASTIHIYNTSELQIL